MSDLLFKRGLLEGLKTLEQNGLIQNGTVYFTTDEGGMYIGLDNNTAKRVQGSVIYYETAQDFLAETKPPYSSDVLYFIANNKFVDGKYEAWNALIRWDATEDKFIQINVTASTVEELTARVSEAETSIADIEAALSGYDADSKKWKTLDDLIAADAHLQDEIDAIHETLKGVATDANLSSLTNRVEAVENKASSLESAIGDIGDKTVATLISELDAKKANASDLTTLSGTVTTLSGTVDGIDGRLGTAEGEIDDIQVSIGQLQAKDNELIASIGTKADASTVSALRERVEAVEGVNTTQNSRLDAVEKRVTDNEVAIGDLQDGVSLLETDVANLKEASGKHVLRTEYEAHLTQFEALQKDVEKKAEQSALQTAIDDITTNKNNISTINATLSTKADQSALDSAKTELQNNINAVNSTATQNAANILVLQGEIGGITDNSNTISELTGRVAANETGLAGAQANINTLTSTKADKTEVEAISGKLGNIGDKTVAELIADNAKNISDNAAEIVKLVAADAAINASIAGLVEADQEINRALADKVASGDFTKLTSRVTVVEGQASENAAAIAGIAADYLTSADKATLSAEIASKINAANAMSYKGTVSDFDDLPLAGAADATEGVSAGDTYVAGGAFKINGSEQVYAGDLLIATGTENTNNVITSNLVWQRVDTGYISAHESVLDLQKIVSEDESIPEYAKIRLSSYVDPDSGDLGTIAIKGTENITITSTVENNQMEMNIGMQWGTF